MAQGLIQPKHLYSSQSFSVIVAAGTGAIQDAHMRYWLKNVYPKRPNEKYKSWSCGDMEWKPMWCGINGQLLMCVEKYLIFFKF